MLSALTTVKLKKKKNLIIRYLLGGFLVSPLGRSERENPQNAANTDAASCLFYTHTHTHTHTHTQCQYTKDVAAVKPSHYSRQ